MSPIRTLAFLALLPLAACSGIRPFDGVIGYEAKRDPAGTLRVDYTAEAKKSWEKLEGKALQACVQELQTSAAALQLQVTGKEELIKEVPFSLRMPVGMTSYGTPSRDANGDGTVQHTVFQQQSGTSPMKLKKISVSCLVK